MTLIVSMRVPDGIVLGGDSLATFPGAVGLKMDTEGECPHCGHEHPQVDLQERLVARVECPDCSQPYDIPGVQIPPAPITRSTASYAQKVFPFLDVYGVGIFGSPALGSKTIFNQLKGLERKWRPELAAADTAPEAVGVSEVAQKIFAFVSEKFEEAFPGPQRALLPQPVIMGLHVVGFDSPDDPTGKSYVLEFGHDDEMRCEDGLHPTYSGDTRIVDGMLSVWHSLGMLPAPGGFSLQDAVDYSEFLVSMTATAQRFATMIPTVGGEVDIALITSYAGFQWIKVKPLTKHLERPLHREDR